MSNFSAACRTCSMRDLTGRHRSALASTSSQTSIDGSGTAETQPPNSIPLSSISAVLAVSLSPSTTIRTFVPARSEVQIALTTLGIVTLPIATTILMERVEPPSRSIRWGRSPPRQGFEHRPVRRSRHGCGDRSWERLQGYSEPQAPQGGRRGPTSLPESGISISA
jgi:hypothetical protein